jgi:acyl-CoA-binding protein
MGFKQTDFTTEQLFNLAVTYVQGSMGKRQYKNSSRELSNDEKLVVYSLYKQATVGPCSENGGERPGFFDFTGKYKWDAWDKLGSMSKEDAMKKYIEALNDLNKGENENWFDFGELDEHKNKMLNK